MENDKLIKRDLFKNMLEYDENIRINCKELIAKYFSKQVIESKFTINIFKNKLFIIFFNKQVNYDFY